MGRWRRRTKPALPSSHTSLKTHQSTGIRRAEIQNREKEGEAEANKGRRRREEERSRKCRRPQVRSSPRYLARPVAQTLLLPMMTMLTTQVGSNVSRREMSLPVSVVGGIDIAIGAVGAIDIALLPSRNCPPLPLLHHLPPPSTVTALPSSPFLLSSSSSSSNSIHFSATPTVAFHSIHLLLL